MKRREFVMAAAAFAALPEAQANDAAMRDAIRAWAGRDPEAGPLKIEIAELVENGNAVPVRVIASEPTGSGMHVHDTESCGKRRPVAESTPLGHVAPLGFNSGKS